MIPTSSFPTTRQNVLFDPAKSESFVRRETRARRRALASLGLGIVVGVAYTWRLLTGEPTGVLVVLLFVVIPFIAITVVPVLLLRGARDRLILYESGVDVPTRSLLDAFWNRPNTFLHWNEIARWYVPPETVPFLGLKTKDGRVYIVHESLAGNRSQLCDQLRLLDIEISSNKPPPSNTIILPSLMRGRKGRSA